VLHYLYSSLDRKNYINVATHKWQMLKQKKKSVEAKTADINIKKKNHL
jgi:hypothetical protein